MTIATVNDLATGATRRRIGSTLAVIGPGQNSRQTIVRGPDLYRPEVIREFVLPRRWLDFDAVDNAAPLPTLTPRPLVAATFAAGWPTLADSRAAKSDDVEVGT